MTPSDRTVRRRITACVGIGATIIAVLSMSWSDSSGASAIGRVLLAPGIVGYFLVGGVHAASMTTLTAAYAIANGVAWSTFAFFGATLWMRSQSQSPA